MAGKGSRFKERGYVEPKPLIPVHGIPMISLVKSNLTPKQEHSFTFICQREHMEQYDLLGALAGNNVELIPIDYTTEGQLCTILLARETLNTDDPVMLSNCDQYIDYDINDFLAKTEGLDGLIMTMPSDGNPKWSFVALDEDGLVIDAQEKKPIGKDALTGIYWFKSGKLFLKYADQFIKKNIRVNNEFYVTPSLNEWVRDGMRLGVCNIGENMYGLGTPDDLEKFLHLPVSNKI